MRSQTRTEEQMLANEAKRFPKVAALLDRVHVLTDEEIDNADVPLLWYKKALRNLRNKMKDKLATQQAFEAKMLEYSAYIVDSKAPDPIGEIREWRGGDAWVTMTMESQLQVSDGKLIWLPMTGGVWVETVFSATPDPRMWSHTVAKGMASRSQYTETYKAALAQRVGIKLYTWEDEEQAAGPSKTYRLDGRTDGLNVTQQGPR